MIMLSPDPKGIKMFVLDEADEMLSRGFKDQIYDVFRKLPSNIQVKSLTSLLGVVLVGVRKGNIAFLSL